MLQCLKGKEDKKKVEEAEKHRSKGKEAREKQATEDQLLTFPTMIRQV